MCVQGTSISKASGFPKIPYLDVWTQPICVQREPAIQSKLQSTAQQRINARAGLAAAPLSQSRGPDDAQRLGPLFKCLRPLHCSPFVPSIRRYEPLFCYKRLQLSEQRLTSGRGTMWMGPSDNKQETARPSSMAFSLTFLPARIAFGFMSSWWHYGVQLYPAWNSCWQS